MKLSEKLAALEEQEGDDAPPTPLRSRPRRSPSRRRSAAARAARDGATSSWDDMKRKVRTLVLDEMADRIKTLDAEERETELREALDRILQREDISVTPIERRRVRRRDGVRHPRLRPARPAARRGVHHRGDVQRLRRHLGGARRPHRADGHQVPRRRPVPPGDREDRVVGRPARRRVLAHGGRPSPRRLPRATPSSRRWRSTARCSPSGSSPRTPSRPRTSSTSAPGRWTS